MDKGSKSKCQKCGGSLNVQPVLVGKKRMILCSTCTDGIGRSR